MKRLIAVLFALVLTGCASTQPGGTPRIAVMSAFEPELTLLADFSANLKSSNGELHAHKSPVPRTNTSPSPAATPVIHGDRSRDTSRNANACKSTDSNASDTDARDDATTLRGLRLRKST